MIDVWTYVHDVVDSLSVEQSKFNEIFSDVANSLTKPLADDQLAVAVDRRPGLRVPRRRFRLRRRRRSTRRFFRCAATADFVSLLLSAV